MQEGINIETFDGAVVVNQTKPVTTYETTKTDATDLSHARKMAWDYAMETGDPIYGDQSSSSVWKTLEVTVYRDTYYPPDFINLELVYAVDLREEWQDDNDGSNYYDLESIVRFTPNLQLVYDTVWKIHDETGATIRIINHKDEEIPSYYY